MSSSKQEAKKLENQLKSKIKKSKTISTNTVDMKNTSATRVREICSSTRDTAFSHRLIPLGPVLDNSNVSDFSLTSSMIAHWTPLVHDFQSPNSISTMATHCVKQPPREDILTEMKKWIEDYWKNLET